MSCKEYFNKIINMSHITGLSFKINKIVIVNSSPVLRLLPPSAKFYHLSNKHLQQQHKKNIYLFEGQLEPISWCGIFSLCWRAIGDLRLSFALWYGSCFLDTFAISNFDFIQIHAYLLLTNKISGDIRMEILFSHILFDKNLYEITS